jgi:hypothetical protein
MNLLLDVPITDLYRKLQSKSGRTKDKDCELTDFSVLDILNAIGDGNCQYTGKGFDSLDDISFERINPKLGYVRGNVVMVKGSVNQTKGCLDSFVKTDVIPLPMKIKLMRKAIYQLEKELKTSLA